VLNDGSVEVLLSLQSSIRALFSGARLAAESGVENKQHQRHRTSPACYVQTMEKKPIECGKQLPDIREIFPAV
jgi:hypothetical protein